MKPIARKPRPPIKYPGGKQYLARPIVRLMPEHEKYGETHAGGLAVLMNKPRSAHEIVNDIDERVCNFWRVMSGDMSYATLRQMLAVGDYCKATFEWAKTVMENQERPASVAPLIWEAEKAACYFRRNRMSRSALGKDFGWSDRLRRGMPEYLSAYETAIGGLEAAHERMRGVTVRNADARDTIELYADEPDWLWYADPPYLHETRTCRKLYSREMSRAQHVKLLGTLTECRGKVILSGYKNPLYDLILQGWHRIDREMPNHMGQGKKKERRIECVYLNYDPPEDAARGFARAGKASEAA